MSTTIWNNRSCDTDYAKLYTET